MNWGDARTCTIFLNLNVHFEHEEISIISTTGAPIVGVGVWAERRLVTQSQDQHPDVNRSVARRPAVSRDPGSDIEPSLT